VTGNRVLLSPELSARVLRDGLRPQSFGLAQWIDHRLRGNVNRLAPIARLPLGPLRRRVQGQWRGARSCNLAVWRTDLEQVDGFDARFRGWGREDSDLAIRLLRAGTRRKDGRFATGVIHLWHSEADRGQVSENDAQLSALLVANRVRAQLGLSSLRAGAPP
jgi:hypothetical protein